jgi:tetratricopeptide (TPR) repeat protein
MISLDEVKAAFDAGDYREATKLLKVLLKESPENPWVQFYVAKLYEVTDKLEAAEKIYRKLLSQARNPKVVSQARDGLKRVEMIPKERRQVAIARAKEDPGQLLPGLLVLEPIDPELKTQAAQSFARIMQLDLYSARLLLPTRSWRMYRTGAIGELRVFVDELRKANIPAFCATIEQINRIRVFRTSYFPSISPQATVVCQNEMNQVGQISFNWSEVTQLVSGLLPIFEEVGVQNHRRTRTNYKQKISNYVGVCDLHLPQRGCILRLCQDSYEFQQGFDFTPEANQPAKGLTPKIEKFSTQLKWQNMLKILKEKLPLIACWSDFTSFAETTLQELDMLDRMNSHIDLLREVPTNWDPAFQLYSGLVFLRPSL